MSVTHKTQFAADGRTFIDPNPAAAVPYAQGDLVHLDGYDRSHGGVTLLINGPACHKWVGLVCTSTWPAQIVPNPAD